MLRGLVVAGTFGLALVGGGTAHACTTSTLGCATGSIAGSLDSDVDGAGDVLEGTLEPVEGVDDLIDDAGDTATGAIDDVTGGTPPLPGVDPPGRDPTPPSSAPEDPRGEDHRERRDPERWVGATRGGRAAPTFAAQGSAPSPLVTASSAAGTAPAGAGERFGDALAAAVPSLAALTALFGLVLAFVAVQARVDRRDPRLAAAPLADEVVSFE